MAEAKNIIGPRIRAARLEEKPAATQQDISARLAVIGITLSASSIGKIENGTRPVTDIQLMGFAKVLKVTPHYLLGVELPVTTQKDSPATRQGSLYLYELRR